MRRVSVIFLLVFTLKNAFAQTPALPPIDEVQKEALDYARMRPEELSDLKKRARRAAMLPHLQVGAKHSIQDDIDISINDNVSVSGTGVNIGPETTDLQQSSDADTAVEVKAVWSLNELIFNRDMLDVAEEARYQMRERRQLVSEVNKLYFGLQLLEANNGKSKESPAIQNIRRSEIIADLDALTGGWFSRQISQASN